MNRALQLLILVVIPLLAQPSNQRQNSATNGQPQDSSTAAQIRVLRSRVEALEKEVHSLKSSEGTAKLDSWQKVKDCAAQAKMARDERNRSNAALGLAVAAEWVSHYSPKYNRCFAVGTWIMDQQGYFKHEFATTRNLIDPFEGASIASAASAAVSPSFACRDEGKPNECEDGIKDIIAAQCEIDHNRVDCAKAEEFIKDHMKN
jgi:hypothetical protein